MHVCVLRRRPASHAALVLVEMFNCIVDTVEDSSSVRSYRKFLIANFCYTYIHKTIKLTEHYNTQKHRQLQQQSESNYH